MDIEAIKQFLATDEGKALIENSESIAGLKTKKDELLSKNVVLSNQLKDYAALGDIATLRAALEKVSAVDEKKDDKTVVDPKLTAQIEHLTKELESERGLRTKREQALVGSFAQAEIASVIAKHKGVPELLSHVVSSRVEASLTDEGKITLVVKNVDGSPMFKNGKEASVEDLITEIKANPIFGRAFDADTNTGSGARAQKPVKQSVDLDDPSVNLTEMMKKGQKR